MSLYIIDYDLRTPGKNYEELIKKIRTYDWAKICESSWAVRSYRSAKQILDSLTPYLDSNDKLFVALISDWASYGLPKEVVNWLNRN